MTALIRPSHRIAGRPTIFQSHVSTQHMRALVALLGAGLMLSVLFFVLSHPREEHVLSQSRPDPNTSATELVEREVFVHVAGDVRNPGVFALPQGARVIDAVTAAGGVLPGADTRTVNLARILIDGEQIIVGVAVNAAGSQRVDLNTATADELDRLPGIGPVIAERIVAWRNEHGRFRRIEQLQEVAGVGASTFASLRKLIIVQ